MIDWTVIDAGEYYIWPLFHHQWSSNYSSIDSNFLKFIIVSFEKNLKS